MKKIKNIAIIALESKKTDLIEWSYFNRNLLAPHNVFALGVSANILEGTLNKKVNISDAGRLGEIRALCTLINNGEIDAVIIFGEAGEILENKDLNGVLEAAITNNIIVAVNKTTADFILQSSLIETDYIIHKEDKKITEKQLGAGNSFQLAKAS